MANTLFIDVQQGKGTINKHIYGHFAEHLGRCIYEGFWVGEDSEIPNTRGIRNDVVEALKKLNIPNLRWPGGCFADEYHWMDGIGPREERPSMVNTHWGGVTENNHFGTHEFFDLCEMLGADAYVCGNVGSGSVHEMAQWVEYCCHDGESPMANLRRKNGREAPWNLPYFGVGNESWGCGGNMRPEFYADAYRLYQTYVRNYGGQKVFKIACGANDFNFQWTEVLMERAGNYMNGLSLHYYTVPGPWEKKGSATVFGEDDWYLTIAKSLRMDEIVTRHSEIMDKYDPQKRVGLIVDEWGTWFDVEPGTNPGFLYQQNTLRDAFVAGITLNIFNEHCDRVHMANIAQTINVLQSMILTDGAKIILTPTYHVFEMWKVHQNATLLPIEMKTETIGSGENQISAVHSSASKTADGVVNLTLCHTHPRESTTIEIELVGNSFANVAGRILTASELNTHNTFDAPTAMEPRELSADEIRLDGNRLTLRLPAASLVVVSCTP